MNKLATVDFTNQQNHESHHLTQSDKVKKIEIPDNCSICLYELQNTQQQQITKLACYHLYHTYCFKAFLESSTDNATSIKCPDCRETTQKSAIKQYSNVEEFKKDLPLECSKSYCTAFGTEDHINKNMQLCPYPLASFPYQSADNFLENNFNEIKLWLEEQFARKNLSDIKVFYTPCYQPEDKIKYYNKPAILVNLSNYLHMTYRFNNFYSSVDINQGKNSQECFRILLYDLRTDLMIHQLNKAYPNLFNTNTEAYMSHYDFYEDAIFFNVNSINKQISLKQVFDLESKLFNWEKLKELLGTDCYVKLFSGKKIKSACSYLSRSYGNSGRTFGNFGDNSGNFGGTFRNSGRTFGYFGERNFNEDREEQRRSGSVCLFSGNFGGYTQEQSLTDTDGSSSETTRGLPDLNMDIDDQHDTQEENLNIPTGTVSLEDYII